MTPQAGAAGSFGIGAVSSALTGIATSEEGIQQQRAYDYNADVTELNAANSIVSVEQRYSQLVGKQATAYATAGVDITRGSPLLMMAATAGRGGRQAEEIKQSADEESTLERYYGKIAAWRGRLAGIGSFLSGISSASQQYLKATGYQGGDGGDGGGGAGSDSTGGMPTGRGGVNIPGFN